MRASAGNPAEIVRFLAATEIMRDLDETDLQKIAERLDSVSVRAGKVLVRQGNPGDALYVVVTGRLRISVTRKDAEASVAEVGRGDVIGEMSLLTGEPRAATATTVRDSQLLRLSKPDFLFLVKQRPAVLLGISRLVIKRLQGSLKQAPPQTLPRTLAVAPIGGERDAAGFTEQLVRALGEHGSVIGVDRDALSAHRRHAGAIKNVGERILLDPRRLQRPVSTDLRRVYSPESVVDGEITRWLHRMEASHDFVVYVCESELSSWTLRCLRQADRVLLVGSVKGSVQPGGIERALDEFDAARADGRAHVQRELVIVHEPGSVERPRGTNLWLKARKPLRVHHLRAGDEKDLQRLSRTLLGRQVGLVLGGGGARGCAHIGVLRALEESDVPIDTIGGTSVGAIMAAGPAMGWNWKQLLAGVKRTLVDPGPPIDYTLPMTALTKGDKATTLIRNTYGDYHIEDLWLPYFCVSSNLTRGAINVHRTGLLWKAVRASVALPGILPPMRSPDGDVLVDGAIMNNLPVDVMHERWRGGRILAVNVRPDVHMSAGVLPDDGVVSGWSLLGRTVNAFGTRPKMPGIFELLLRTTETGNVLSTQEHEAGAELTFNPPVAGVGLMEFSACDKLTEIGYRHAMEKLEGWLGGAR